MLPNTGRWQRNESGLWVQPEYREYSELELSAALRAYRGARAVLPNASATSGDGSVMATHSISGKEYEVVMLASPEGHIVGSRDDYFVYFTPVTNAASREVGEIFNATTGATIIRVRGVWIIPTITAITGAQIAFALNRISAVGTTSSTAVTPRPTDKNFAALDANVTARFGSTAGGTLDVLLFEQYGFNEETNAGTLLSGFFNLLPVLGDHTVEVVLRTGQGLQVKQTSLANTVGLTGALMYFTTE